MDPGLVSISGQLQEADGRGSTATALVAEVQQHTQINGGDGEDRVGAGHRRWVLFVTGLLSHYQYEPWSWLPEPAKPVWGYRLTQGIHVATGIATIPLLLFKLWSVYPNQFRFPPIRSIKHAIERLSVAILVSTHSFR